MADQRIVEHYAGGDFIARLDQALDAAGLDRPGIAAADLARVDQFHTRGRPATLELAKAAGLKPDMRVLDLGSGVGGPARTLAAEIGCAVTGLDLVADYCRAARRLSWLTGLDDRVRFVCGSALQAPFADGSFDLLWTQHAAMNIADKKRLYGECARLLVPCGRLALNDIVAGPAGPPHFPQPWARDPATSFLASADELRGRLAVAGFQIVAWEDKTATVADWARDMLAKRAAQAGGDEPALGLHLLLGPDFAVMAANLARSLRERRLEVVSAVLEIGCR
jgi:SAM-dependent methyltransferase